MQYLLYIALVTIIISHTTQARPVSYPGGVTFMQMNDNDTHSLHIHYSPTAQYSLGYKGEYWQDKEWQFHGLQLNYLVNRWNKPNSQANIYSKSGFGIAHTQLEDSENKNEFATFTGISMDWENRRFFTLYENRFYEAHNIDSFFTQKARIGIAPYIGDYGDLHTWFMLQVDHNPEKDDTIYFTPLLRFFKHAYLTELGISENGNMLINFVIRL